jgi:predicted phosphodiesterase
VVRLGCLSDIHGNRTALEAVIADGTDRGVQQWWALGDLVAVGPDPLGTLEMLANLPDVLVTSGNTERYVVTGDRPTPHADDVVGKPELLGLLVTVEASFSWTRGALSTDGRLDWLAALPLEVRIELDDGTRLLGVHASPGQDDGAGITPHRPDNELCAALEGADADIVISGHTHQPTDRTVAGIRAVNGRSVPARRAVPVSGAATRRASRRVLIRGGVRGYGLPAAQSSSAGSRWRREPRSSVTPNKIAIAPITAQSA